MLIRGEYLKCIAATKDALIKKRYGETWPYIKAEAEMRVGQYNAGLQTIEHGISRYAWSIRLRWLGRELALREGNKALADQRLAEIEDLVKRFPWRYTDASELVVLGQVEQMKGTDARDVLDNFFVKARQRSSSNRDAWLAIGNLALDKADYGFAAETFRDAIKKSPNDPDFHFGLTRATASSDPKTAMVSIATALKLNPRHIPSMLYQVDRLISSEQYELASELIGKVLAINRYEPKAWAYRAIIAHFLNDPRGEAAFRDEALARWSSNPSIPHLIGKKLSQHYRFREGAEYQQWALKIDAGFVAAQRQLASDLLRLGQEEEGWTVAEAAHEKDSYNVQTFNLMQLRDELGRFTTLQDEHFFVRMESKEAALYGDEVLRLLNQARTTLCEKYGLEIKERVTVEIFPDENDFAVRTFGMPAVSGYLGVCFGSVITANSPASRRENPSNWESVLWHEFCHVVTLQLTRNRIPRWLSEGISVYEELQADAKWGQQMTPRYRAHILGDGLTPLGKLSSAFMNPESGWHLQFAYFESALAVDFLVQSYGLKAMRHVLADLAAGLPVNVALDRRCAPLGKLESDFEAFAKKQAQSLAPDVDWSKPELAILLNEDNDALDAWVKEHPKNLVGLIALANRQIEDELHEAATRTLQKLIQLYPGNTGGDNPYVKLAAVYRKLDRPLDERKVLETLTALEGSNVGARLRLLELQQSDRDWQSLLATSKRLAAIDPLLRQGHLAGAAAAEQLKEDQYAIRSLERLLLLEPDDLADAHFRLARLLYRRGEVSRSRRHVLMALEEAPRFRDAHRLLLKIVAEPQEPKLTDAASEAGLTVPATRDSAEGTADTTAEGQTPRR